MSARLSWDQYFMTITQQVAERSTCARAKVGAVIVRDKNIEHKGRGYLYYPYALHSLPESPRQHRHQGHLLLEAL